MSMAIVMAKATATGTEGRSEKKQKHKEKEKRSMRCLSEMGIIREEQDSLLRDELRPRVLFGKMLPIRRGLQRGRAACAVRSRGGQ